MNEDIRKAERLDNRRTPGNMGQGPDVDDSQAEVDALPSSGFNFTAEGGFYKKSEELKCKAGLPMTSDERGLPPGYATGSSWQRAARQAALESAWKQIADDDS
jgi:hypothetical protein